MHCLHIYPNIKLCEYVLFFFLGSGQLCETLFPTKKGGLKHERIVIFERISTFV